MSTDAIALRGEEIVGVSALPGITREQQLGDLDRVQRGALDEVVAREEENEAVARGAVDANAADEHLVRLRRGARRRDVDDANRGGGREQPRRLVRRELVLELDPHRLRMT